jgi:long-chain acyl-CoA synthetase
MTEELVIHKIFNKIVSRFPDKVALQIKKDAKWQRFTYQQVQTLALKIGAFLIKEGFKKGDFIGLILENRPEWAIIYLGIMQAGSTAVPFDPQLPAQDLKNLISNCQMRIIFTSYKIFREKFNNQLIGSLKRIVILDLEKEQDNLIDFSKINQISEENIAWPAVTPENIASLIYTSGTTAQPKGVVLSHYNLCSNLRSIEKLNLWFPSDNILSILPLHHTYAFMATLLVPLCIGAEVTYSNSIKPEDFLNVIKEANVTILVGVPQIFAVLHKVIFERLKELPFILKLLGSSFIKKKIHHNLGKSLRLFVSGGARLSPKVAKDLSKVGIKIIEGYGLTETSPVVTLNPPEKVKFGSVGLAIPDIAIKILNPDRGGIGEVLIKGPNVMQGYFKQPDLTAEVLKNDWFYSGDLGYLDKEGYLFITGRKKDVIVLSSGENIYPEELEEFFLSKCPYIKEMCILSATEKKFGKEIESLFAVIVPDLEYFKIKGLINIREKIRWEIQNLTKDLPSYKHIMGFCITKDTLPRTPLRKIKRYQVREKYLKEKDSLKEVKEAVLSEEDAKILQTELARKIINYVSRELKKKVYLDSHLEIDLGIDSLSRVELELGLEALLGIKIPQDFMEKVFTVKDLILNLKNIYAPQEGISVVEFKEERKSWSQIIQESPPLEIRNKIKIESSFLDKLLTFIFKQIFGFIFKLIWFLKIEGREFIPKDGPYIFCPNHVSYLDGFIVFSSLRFHQAKNTFFVGFADIFEHPVVSWAIKIARLIPIDPAIHLIEAMQACAFVLKNKKIICIFPEGGRSFSEELQEFKKGIGILVKELNIPLIPVYIQGSHNSWPRTSKFPRPYPLKIIFGKPLNWQDLGTDYETIAQGLREEVLKLRKK